MLNYKSKDKGKSRKPYPGAKKRLSSKAPEKLRDREDDGSKVINDPNWYFSNTMLAEQISNFSFNQFVGVPVDLGGSRINAKYVIPSIAVGYLWPSAGWVPLVDPQRAGINVAGFKLYTELSARNSKTTSYAPQDVTILILALGSVLTMYSYMKRVFGISLVYNMRNRMYAKGLAEALGINFDDFIANRADYLTEFNHILNMINRIAFPANIPYFEKCRTLFDNVYVDSDNAMAQTVVTVPNTVWVFDEAYSQAGSGLRTRTVVDSNSTGHVKAFREYLNILRDQIMALLNSTTLNYIYSDVLAYAAKNPGTLMFNVQLVPTDYSIHPIVSDTFNMQWRNATIVGVPSETAHNPEYHKTVYNDVVSDAEHNCVIYQPEFTATRAWMALDTVLDFSHDNPDVSEIVESTRLAVRADAVLDGETYYSLDVALPDFYLAAVQIIGNDVLNPIATLTSPIVFHTAITHFRYMPRVYQFGGNGAFLQVSGDTEYFTTVNKDYLMRMNDICYQGLFEIR